MTEIYSRKLETLWDADVIVVGSGGGMIVGITVLTRQVDPRFGGILAAAPIITTLAFLFTWMEAGSAVTRDLVGSTCWFVIPTLLFLIALYLLMGRYPFLPSTAGGFGGWILAAAVTNRLLAGV